MRLLLLLNACVLLPTDTRDIAKNSLLRWPVFMYWTCLGVFDAVIFFFGAYFLFDNTTFTSNGQVRLLGELCSAVSLCSVLGVSNECFLKNTHPSLCWNVMKDIRHRC